MPGVSEEEETEKMPDEYISREAMLEHLYRCKQSEDAMTLTAAVITALQCFVQSQPTADVAEVVHGQWYMLDDCANAGLYCSACSRRVHREEFAYKKLKSKYCPHCGARMDGGYER